VAKVKCKFYYSSLAYPHFFYKMIVTKKVKELKRKSLLKIVVEKESKRVLNIEFGDQEEQRL
jgi:hypothetical protein